ncbi:MAG: NAD-dependent epimerase/dehydratase family protein [Bryobacteraceae bacterium]|jgi:CDP-paratose 2-epimerase
MYERILVTGGAGFVGSTLAIAFKERHPETEVIALDNLRRRGSELNLAKLRDAGVGFVHGDVRSPDDLNTLAKPDLILECSAEPSAQAGYGSSPAYLIDTNLAGCFHCLELARRAKSAFVFISTSRVYPYRRLNGLRFTEDATRYVLSAGQNIAGVSEHGIAEDFPLDGPRSLYGMTKLAAELMVVEYGDAYGLPYVIDRCGLLTGPGQMAKSDQGVIALWMAAHYYKKDLAYIGFGGSGKQVRDFLHVDDLFHAVYEQTNNLDRYAGRAFNLGGGLANSLSLLETTALCEEITGNRIRFDKQAENRPGDVRLFVTDYRLYGGEANWHPAKNERSTLKSIFDWIRGNENSLRGVFFG